MGKRKGQQIIPILLTFREEGRRKVREEENEKEIRKESKGREREGGGKEK